MKLIKLKLFILAFVATTVVSCDLGGDDENICSSTLYAPATQVTGPSTATVNEQVTYAVSFNIANSCGAFSSFTSSTGFPKQVAAVVNYNGCSCTPQNTTVTKNFQYTPTQAGTYEFKFVSGTNTFITKTLTVTLD